MQQLTVEEMVIGTLVRNRDYFDHVVGLTAECFSQERLRNIWRSMSSLADENLKAWDPQILGDHCNVQPEFLFDLAMRSPSLDALENCVDRIIRSHYVRQVKMKANEVINSDSETIEERVNDLLDINAGGHTKQTVMTMTDQVDEWIADLKAEATSTATPRPQVGLPLIDNRLRLAPGEVCVLAGRPATGKTTLGLQWALNSVLEQGMSTLVFSLEMMLRQMMGRVASFLDPDMLPASIFRTPSLITDKQWARIAEIADHLRGKGLYVDYHPEQRVSDMRAKARRLSRRGQLDFIVVDYLQLVTPGSENRSREQEVSKMSRNIKIMAKELNVPVLLLAQLNRRTELEGVRPVKGDLRESGSIEQDADHILMLYQHETEMVPHVPHGTGLIEVLTRKSRGGVEGIDVVQSDFAHSRFLHVPPLSERVRTYNFKAGLNNTFPEVTAADAEAQMKNFDETSEDQRMATANAIRDLSSTQRVPSFE